MSTLPNWLQQEWILDPSIDSYEFLATFVLKWEHSGI